MTELISIVIASMGRETLLVTLDSIAGAMIPDDCRVEIVIADDSPDSAVGRLIAGRTSQLPIRLVNVGAQNVSVARNASIDAARGNWLLMVDDDEYVAPDWIVEHVAAARRFNADVVFGPVYPVYPPSTPDWLQRANPQFHDMDWTSAGKRVDFGQSGNTLVNAAALRNLDLRFDPDLGRTGGEDNDFFRRMAAQGAHLVVTDRARAWEAVNPQRATPAYALERMIRGGRIYAHARLRENSIRSRSLFALDAAVKLLVAALGSVALLPVDRARAFRMCMKLFSNFGKLTALVGRQPAAAWTKEIA